MTVKVEWVAGRLPAAVSPAAAVGDTARGLADATARVEQQLLRLARASQTGQESLAALQSSLAAGGQAAATAERQLADYGLGLARQAAQVQQSQRGQRQLAQSQAALSESQAKGARQLAASRQAWQRYQAQLDQLRLEPLRNGLADLQTTLTDNFQAALRGNLKDWTDWADAGRNILTRFLADIASQQVILPAMAGLGGALGLSAQQMGLPAAPGQQAGSLSAMDALGLANQGASAFGVDGLSGLSGLVGAGAGASVGSITAAGSLGAFTSEAALAGSGLAAGAAGGMGGLLAAIPYVGLAGAAATILAPMLFGGDKNYPFGQVGFRGGAFQDSEVDSLDGADTSQLVTAAQQVSDSLASAGAALNIDLSGIQSSFGRASGRDGALGSGFYSVVGGPGGFDADPATVRKFGDDSEAAVADFFIRNLRAGLASGESQASAEVATALENIVIEAGDSLAGALADLDFAETFTAALAALEAGAVSLDATIRGQVTAGLDQALADIQAFKVKTAELGLDLQAATDATAQFARKLLGIDLAADPDSLLPVQTAWRRINATLEEAGPLLAETGIALADLEQAAVGAKATLRENFLADLQLSAGGLDGSLAAILEQRAALRDAAAEIGVLDQAAGYIEQITGTALRGSLNALLLGDLSPLSDAAQLTTAEGFYNQALADYNRSGSGADLSTLNSASQDYLALAAAYYTTASQPYFDIFQDVTAALETAQSDATRQVGELERLLGVDQAQLSVLEDIRQALRSANDNARDWGANAATNRLLAAKTGYQGSFGGGGFAAWIRQQDRRVQVLAQGVLSDAGQLNRLGFLDDLPALRAAASDPQSARQGGALLGAVNRGSEVAADGFQDLGVALRELRKEIKGLREENRALRQDLRKSDQRRAG